MSDRQDPAWATFARDTFTSRVALVTGRSGGMGEETALAFASNGAHVLAADRDADGLEDTVHRCSRPDRDATPR